MVGRDGNQLTPWLRKAWRYGLPLAVVGLVGGAFILGLSSQFGHPDITRDDESPTMLLDVPAFQAPPAVPARSAALHPDAPVIGVSHLGHYRAYAIDAMSRSHSHVINDLLGGIPVTVAYCDRTRCARAFTAPARAEPLDVSVGGWLNDGGVRDMLIRVGAHRYLLKSASPLGGGSPPFPYDRIEVEMSTWQEWSAAHPDTDVYLGGGRKL